jgi:hypothetical protein
MIGCVGEKLPVGVGQFSHDPARNARGKHAGRQRSARRHYCASRDQRAGPNPRAAEHDRADADQRAGLDVRAVHSSPVAKADPVFKNDWLAGVDVQAAQILDVDVSAHYDLVFVSSQNRAVPDRRRPPESDLADDDGTRRDPGLRMNDRAVVTQRPDQDLRVLKVLWRHGLTPIVSSRQRHLAAAVEVIVPEAARRGARVIARQTR